MVDRKRFAVVADAESWKKERSGGDGGKMSTSGNGEVWDLLELNKKNESLGKYVAANALGGIESNRDNSRLRGERIESVIKSIRDEKNKNI